MILRLLSIIRQYLLSVHLSRTLDKLKGKTYPDHPVDPVLLFAGDLPEYPDFVPAEYGVYEKHGSIGSHDIVRYQPRSWRYDDGTFILHEQIDIDNSESGVREFTIKISPSDYVAHRVVYAAADWEEIPLQSNLSSSTERQNPSTS